jgi:predicted RNA-binding protein (virulence factor B family)
VFTPLHVGQETTAYIQHLRPDGKIDLQLKPRGGEALAPAAELILKHLSEHGGTMPYGDFSTPEELQTVFQMSKKTFKKALGTLYKDKKVTLSPDGTQLI